MKKTLLIAFILSCATSFASAAGLKVGITGSGYEIDAVGKEEKLTRTDQNRTETLEGATASLFAEFNVDVPVLPAGLSIGVDYVPYDIDMGAVENARNALGNNNQSNQGSDGQVGTNTADIVLEGSTTLYVLIPTEAGLYLKLGYSEADVIINETMTTGSNYPNQTLEGLHVNLGLEKEMGPIFVRGEVGFSDWDTVKSTSSTGRTTYSADLDGTNVRISIGKAF